MDKSNSPVRETEIGKVMSNLSKAVECLTNSVDATEARLTGIVRNGLPKTVSEEVREQSYSTELAQSINKIHDKIQGLRDRLDDLLSRVEL